MYNDCVSRRDILTLLTMFASWLIFLPVRCGLRSTTLWFACNSFGSILSSTFFTVGSSRFKIFAIAQPLHVNCSGGIAPNAGCYLGLTDICVWLWVGARTLVRHVVRLIVQDDFRCGFRDRFSDQTSQTGKHTRHGHRRAAFLVQHSVRWRLVTSLSQDRKTRSFET
jgi:hypothetical protein